VYIQERLKKEKKTTKNTNK